MKAWDWEAAARRAGAARDGRLNAGAMALRNPRALVWRRAGGTVVTYSGRDLEALGRRGASALRRAGVRRGDRVAGLLGRRPEAYALALGLWQLGAIYVPLFSGFRSSALRVRLEDSGAAFVVTDPENRASLGGLEEDRTIVLVGGEPRAGERSYEGLLEEAGSGVAVAETRLDDPATLMYTSGTTGRPKGCVIPHRAAISLWPYVECCLGLRPDDLLFSTADAGWSFGLYTTGLAPLSLGFSRVLYEGGFDATEWWRAIHELGVTHLASAPTGFRQLAAAGEEAMLGRPTALRGATAAGEALNPEPIRWFEERTGLVIHDSYGLTELGMLVANLRGPAELEPEPGSMGVALPGFAVRVVGESCEPLELGEKGLIAVRDDGWLLSTTYWGRDAEWHARCREGWWVTEDLARRDEAGRFWHVGRSDDVIVTAGYNVGPFEVESVLMEHASVAEAACVAEPDERKGQVVAAHVVLAGSEPDGLGEALRRLVGERIGWHAAPRRVYVVGELPKTESGKVRRSELRAG